MRGGRKTFIVFLFSSPPPVSVFPLSPLALSPPLFRLRRVVFPRCPPRLCPLFSCFNALQPTDRGRKQRWAVVPGLLFPVMLFLGWLLPLLISFPVSSCSVIVFSASLLPVSFLPFSSCLVSSSPVSSFLVLFPNYPLPTFSTSSVSFPCVFFPVSAFPLFSPVRASSSAVLFARYFLPSLFFSDVVHFPCVLFSLFTFFPSLFPVTILRISSSSPLSVSPRYQNRKKTCKRYSEVVHHSRPSASCSALPRQKLRLTNEKEISQKSDSNQ